MPKKPRLTGKRKVRLPIPKPSSQRGPSFELRTINEADSRLSVVKQMRERIRKLLLDCDGKTIQEEWLAARCVYLLGYLESAELEAIEGTPMDWKLYATNTRLLADVLKSLGLKQAKRSTQTLADYLDDMHANKAKKRTKVRT